MKEVGPRGVARIPSTPTWIHQCLLPTLSTLCNYGKTRIILKRFLGHVACVEIDQRRRKVSLLHFSSILFLSNCISHQYCYFWSTFLLIWVPICKFCYSPMEKHTIQLYFNSSKLFDVILTVILTGLLICILIDHDQPEREIRC